MIHISHALGLNNEFIDYDALEVPVHRALVAPLRELKEAAAQAGFRLGLCSGYRSFDRQLHIWNQKARGERKLIGAEGAVLDPSHMQAHQIVAAILLWSALPGASRHHWGCDFDIVDAAVVEAGYQPELRVEECVQGGAFYALHCWLNEYLQQSHCHFYRPYLVSYDYGVAPEPWHLSYQPLASAFAKVLSLESLRQQIEVSSIELKPAVLENLEHIYRHYVKRYF